MVVVVLVCSSCGFFVWVESWWLKVCVVVKKGLSRLSKLEWKLVELQGGTKDLSNGM
jgi:hypothetical protein